MGAEGLGEIGQDASEGRGGLQSVGNVIQVDGAGGDLIWIRVLGPVGGNEENVGRDTHRVSETNHREVGTPEGGQDMVYTGERGRAGSGRNSVGNNLHLTKEITREFKRRRQGESNMQCRPPGGGVKQWGQARGNSEMLGQIQVTPRWEEDPVRRLGVRQATPN